jgi:hypothetical protein
MYISTHSLASALDGGEWSASRPGCFSPREGAPSTHWIGGWVGPRAGLDVVSKRTNSQHQLLSYWYLFGYSGPAIARFEECYRILVSKAAGKRSLGRQERMWKNNISIDRRKMNCEECGWMSLGVGIMVLVVLNVRVLLAGDTVIIIITVIVKISPCGDWGIRLVPP